MRMFLTGPDPIPSRSDVHLSESDLHIRFRNNIFKASHSNVNCWVTSSVIVVQAAMVRLTSYGLLSFTAVVLGSPSGVQPRVAVDNIVYVTDTNKFWCV
jgi:hypothetical protein